MKRGGLVTCFTRVRLSAAASLCANPSRLGNGDVVLEDAHPGGLVRRCGCVRLGLAEVEVLPAGAATVEEDRDPVGVRTRARIDDEIRTVDAERAVAAFGIVGVLGPTVAGVFRSLGGELADILVDVGGFEFGACFRGKAAIAAASSIGFVGREKKECEERNKSVGRQRDMESRSSSTIHEFSRAHRDRGPNEVHLPLSIITSHMTARI